MKTPLIDIRPDHWKIVRDILHKHVPRYEVWAFGSRAKWTAKEYSDLDLAVITDRPLSVSVSASLSDDLSESDLPYKVDVVDWATTGESFRKIIRRDKVVVQKARSEPRAGMAGEELVGPLPAGWKYTTLGEACARAGGGVQTGPFGSQLHAADYVPHGVPSIMPQNIGENRVVRDGIARITIEDAQRLSRYLVRSGDIVYSRRGDVERRALIRDAEDGWLCGTGCLRVRFGGGFIDPTFASYYLGDPRVREWVVRHAHGATMPNLNTGILSALPFVEPPLAEQRAIAQILGALDDKIELNRRMNETLEAMARALFKSWFVDFDPVRAKAEGRDPGLPQPFADLFPDSFEDSELGEIPRGWEVKSIGDLANVVGGTTPSTKNSAYWDGGEHAWATPKDLSALSVPVLLDTERRISHAGLAQIGSGLLPKGTVLLSSRAPIGYLAVAEIPVAINQGFIAMTPRSGTSNLFLLLWASVAHEEIVSRANGSTFLEISKTNFRPIPVVAPSPEVMRKFEQLARPLYERIVECARESRCLATLQDALLPKLVSGQVRVGARHS